MPYQLVFTDDNTRRALRFPRRHPEPKAQHTKTLVLLEAHPHHLSLRLHALIGRMAGLHSVSIKLPHRITLELLTQDQRIIPINVGGTMRSNERYGRAKQSECGIPPP